jgi:hypothetical protein
VNVAFVGSLAFLWDTTPEDYDDDRHHLHGQVNGTRAALARMRHNRHSVAVIAVRTLTGIALLTQSRPLLNLVGQSADENVAIYARILGARHLVEAAILWRWTTPTVVRTCCVAVDAIHAASALALVKTRHHPRLATLNVASASMFALLGAALVRNFG